MPEFAAANAVNPLTTITSDGSGEALHPSVYDAGAGNTWNGYRYWMAITPFPDVASPDSYENPEILASSDGNTWVVPAGLTNPIDPTPASGYNSDVELYMEDGTLYCIWREYNDPAGPPPPDTTETIYYKSSTDGVTWSAAVQMMQNTNTIVGLSPSVIKIGSTYIMYTCNTAGYINRWTASALSGPWSSNLQIRPPTMTTIWHIDALHDGTYYWILVYSNAAHDLWLMRSRDGITFDVTSAAVLSPSGIAGRWDENTLYRAAFLKTGENTFDVWYTGGIATEVDGGAVHIGRTTLATV
jgi:hypothetical protein